MSEFYVDPDRPFTARAEDNLKRALVGAREDVLARSTVGTLECIADRLGLNPQRHVALINSWERDIPNKLYFNKRYSAVARCSAVAESVGSQLCLSLLDHEPAFKGSTDSTLRDRSEGTLDQTFSLVVSELHLALGYDNPAIGDGEITERVKTFAGITGTQPFYVGHFVRWLEESCVRELRTELRATSNRNCQYETLEKLALTAQMLDCDLVTAFEPKPVG